MSSKKVVRTMYMVVAVNIKKKKKKIVKWLLISMEAAILL